VNISDTKSTKNKMFDDMRFVIVCDFIVRQNLYERYVIYIVSHREQHPQNI